MKLLRLLTCGPVVCSVVLDLTYRPWLGVRHRV
nr:MAG TPA: hypothetical protein [Caudoviricetes sp.]